MARPTVPFRPGIRRKPIPRRNSGYRHAGLQALGHNPRLDLIASASLPVGPDVHPAVPEKHHRICHRETPTQSPSGVASQVRRKAGRWGPRNAYSELHDQGCDCKTLPLRNQRSTANTPRGLLGGLQLRPKAQDAERHHALRIHLQNLDIRAGSIHPQSYPRDAGTEHLDSCRVTNISVHLLQVRITIADPMVRSTTRCCPKCDNQFVMAGRVWHGKLHRQVMRAAAPRPARAGGADSSAILTSIFLKE